MRCDPCGCMNSCCVAALINHVQWFRPVATVAPWLRRYPHGEDVSKQGAGKMVRCRMTVTYTCLSEGASTS
jgi:hypothetical protein